VDRTYYAGQSAISADATVIDTIYCSEVAT